MSQTDTRAPGRRSRIIVADDDPIFRSLVQAKLASTQADVFEAEDGFDAWHQMTAQRFHLALVDLEMPNLNGFALIQCIRSHPASRHMPIVVCTSREDSQAIRKALAAGASSYMTKPINWSLFNAHIEHLMKLASDAEQASLQLSQLRTAMAAKDAIVAGVHAETRARMRRIASRAQAAFATEAIGTPAGQTLAAIAEEARCTREAIETLYPAYQLLNTDAVCDLRPLPLDSTIARVTSDLTSDAEARDVEWRCTIHSGLTVLLDQRSFVLALHEMLRTAVHTSKVAGIVSINAFCGPAGVVIVISNEGDGMPAREAADCQLQISDAMGQRGSGKQSGGLDLLAMRAVVEGLGCELSISSALGQGVTMKLSVPSSRVPVGVTLGSDRQSNIA